MVTMSDAHDRTRDASQVVARIYVDMSAFVTRHVGGPGTAAAGPAGQEALDRLQRLGCLSLALRDRLDALDELAARVAGRDEPALRAELLRLASAPCPVRFTTITGAQPYQESLEIDHIVAQARECERGIRRAEGGSVSAGARGLRAQLARLEDLLAAAERGGLGHGREPLDAAVLDALDRLGRWEKGDTGEDVADLPQLLAAATHRVTRRRRELRQSLHTELAARFAGYRRMAADEGTSEHLALVAYDEAARTALRPEAFDLGAAVDAVTAYQKAVHGERP